jgi:hypothetical protein
MIMKMYSRSVYSWEGGSWEVEAVERLSGMNAEPRLGLNWHPALGLSGHISISLRSNIGLRLLRQHSG